MGQRINFAPLYKNNVEALHIAPLLYQEKDNFNIIGHLLISHSLYLSLLNVHSESEVSSYFLTSCN